MAKNSGDSDMFKQAVKGLCKINNISPRKPRFEITDNIVSISIKNHLKDGIDLECFKILNFIYRITGRSGLKFTQQLYLYPNSERVARVTVSFDKEDYDTFNLKMKDGNFSN
ncbi:hypothetical protein J7E26_04655 [Bacillus sp. ISL-51]|uniref:hypothetical protein n=1 Tax=Bacteria TaxID=2 RepID=UPI001BEB6E0D|nr:MULTISPECIES: hypothetical protein [Bacteria]MBT2573234.1 hypothetical protein [Bacillus sp. ISL-51]MBT2635138.1 hypothetical protein [Bacillus sp. ISL-26]MBT2711940.1 hypothetical protein [Pseudomonas sp. ISL-88]